MAGKFMSRKGMVDTKKSEEVTNSFQKREGLTKHPVHTTVCQCPNPNCGAWHDILTDRNIPTDDECVEILKKHNKDKSKNA